MIGNNSSLVSITIPTLNSAGTLAATLESVKRQTYTNVEMIVVDGNSSDGSASIAREMGARVMNTNAPLLAARILGIDAARGEFTVLLDSDQILSPDCIARSLKLSNSYDMLCLGETTTRSDLFVPRLLDASRAVVQSNPQRYMNPYSGVLIPRFFASSLLRRAAANVPDSARKFVTDRDHQILFFEAYRLSTRVGFLPQAVRHSDPSNLVEVWKKAARWGLGSGRLYASGLYRELLESRYSLRVRSENSEKSVDLRLQLAANFIALIKGFPYEAGFRLGQLRGPSLPHS